MDCSLSTVELDWNYTVSVQGHKNGMKLRMKKDKFCFRTYSNSRGFSNSLWNFSVIVLFLFYCSTVQLSIRWWSSLSIEPIPFKYTSCIYTAIKSRLKVRFSMSTQSWTLGKLHSTPEKGVKGGHLKDLLTSNRFHTCIFFSMIKPSLLCSCIPSALMMRWQINAMI